jgi:hypothetical protein
MTKTKAIKAFCFGMIVGMFFTIAAAFAGKAVACDPGQYYDPSHQICQGSAPAYPQPGFGPWQNNYPGFPQAPGQPGYPGGGWGR